MIQRPTISTRTYTLFPYTTRFRSGVWRLVGEDENALAVLAPVAGLLPRARVHDLRRLDLAISRAVDGAAHIGFQLSPDHIAPGVPEHRAMRLLLEVEQVHLLAQLAMVAVGRFLQPVEVRVELLSV